ncbi:DUF2306 domain-containing protein [soil metagenome]
MTAHVAGVPASRNPRPQWLAPTALILLSLIPVIVGAARLTELTSGAIATEQTARFLDFPIPVVTHIVSVTVYSLLGAFQFVPALRHRRIGWHRIAGRILVPAGLLAALSGLWMTGLYRHAQGYGDLIAVFRLIFGSAMVASIILGIRAIARHDFVAHSAWMTRAYAIGLGAGTQALVLIPDAIVLGSTQNLLGALLMGTAWVINLAAAEFVISRQRGARAPGRLVSIL